MKQEQIFSSSETTAINKLAFIIKTTKSLQCWVKQVNKSKQRYLVLEELYKTQIDYCQKLKTIKNVYQRLLVNANLIDQQNQKFMFSDIQPMISLSQKMIQCFENKIISWNPMSTNFGQEMISFHKFFIIYRTYWQNYIKIQSIINQLKQNPKTQEILGKMILDFSIFMFKPTKRPVQYELILVSYLKKLPKSHKDYKIIEQAIGKYHQLIQQNNDSIYQQTRAEKMIQIYNQFGRGIISNQTTRQYLNQFTSKMYEDKFKIYVFTDMLLLILVDEEGRQFYHKQINLNHISFVEIKSNLKHNKNVVFVGGANDSAHLQFNKKGDADHFIQEIDSIIIKLKEKEQQKLTRLSQQQTKHRIMNKIMKQKRIKMRNIQKQIHSFKKPKLQITVEGTHFRNQQSYFYIKFKIVSPYKFAQTIVFTLSQLLKLQQYLTEKYKGFHIPRIDESPKHISWLQQSNRRTKMLQYRSFLIQQFLMIIFRSELLRQSWKSISRQLGINYSFFQFATSKQFTCQCERCIEMKQDDTFPYYQSLLDNIELDNNNQYRLTFQGSYSQESIPDNISCYTDRYSSNLKNIFCSIYVFNLMYNISKIKRIQSNSLKSRMLRLEAQMGHLNYHKLKDDNKNKLVQPLLIKIKLLSSKDNIFQIKLSEDRYVRQILQDFGFKNQLQTVYDLGLFLQVEQELIKIGNDQKILQFCKKLGAQLGKQEQNQVQETFFQKLMNFKKWGSNIPSLKKGRIILKKIAYFQPSLQFSQCQKNIKKSQLFIQEQFYRIKNGQLILNEMATIKLSCYFLLLNDLKNLSQNRINFDLLSKILPKKLWSQIEENNFQLKLIGQLAQEIEENKIACTLRNELQLIQTKIFKLFSQSQWWAFRFFPLTTYKSNTSNDVVLAVSYQKVLILTAKERQIVYSFEIQQVKFKTTTYSLWINKQDTNSEDYRFDGANLWEIDELIKLYQTYHRLFNY